MKVVLIYNPGSGGEYGLRSIKKLFKEYDISIDYSFTVRQLGSKKLQELIKNGVTVAAIGGDGTLNAVARLVVDTKSTLFPLPGGTFNHFIRDLGMSPKIEENLARIKGARTQRVDVAYVNDELFLNNSNIGLYPFSLIERKQTKKILGKWPAALLSAFDQLSVFRRHKLSIDGETVHSPFVFIGNNIFESKNSLIPQRTKLTDGVLTVMVASSHSRSAFARAILSLIKGDVSKHDDFNVETRRTIEIYSQRPRLLVSYDGEVKKLDTPLKYSIGPKALRVLVVEQ